LRTRLDAVRPAAAGEAEVLLDVEVGGIELLRATIVQNGPAEVFLEKIGVGEVVAEPGVPDAALVDDLLVEKDRFVIKGLGGIGIVGGVGGLNAVFASWAGIELGRGAGGGGLGGLASSRLRAKSRR
jgi:hypothetical protein